MKILLLLIFFFCCNSIVAQLSKNDSSILAKKIVLAVDSMTTAFKQKDLSTFSRFNYSGIKKIMGGEEAFIETIKASYKQLPDSSLKEIRAGRVHRIVKEKNSLQCIVEQILKIKVNTVTVSSISYLVGESRNNGNTWSFFDASAESIFLPNNKVMPNLSKKLIIPKKQQKVDYQ